MTRGKLVRVLGYYTDASYIERVVATFRKLLIDVDWIYGRRVDDEGLYELIMLVRDHPNFTYAILNLSKTVGVEKVEVYDSFTVKNVNVVIKPNSDVNGVGKESTYRENVFTLYVPIYSRVVEYSWGEIRGKDIS